LETTAEFCVFQKIQQEIVKHSPAINVQNKTLAANIHHLHFTNCVNANAALQFAT
jgi:hypothetical protein